VVAAYTAPGGAQVLVARRADLRPVVSFTLGGASRVGLRILGTNLSIADDRGRVLAFDLGYGRLVDSVRLSP